MHLCEREVGCPALPWETWSPNRKPPRESSAPSHWNLLCTSYSSDGREEKQASPRHASGKHLPSEVPPMHSHPVLQNVARFGSSTVLDPCSSTRSPCPSEQHYAGCDEGSAPAHMAARSSSQQLPAAPSSPGSLYPVSRRHSSSQCLSP